MIKIIPFIYDKSAPEAYKVIKKPVLNTLSNTSVPETFKQTGSDTFIKNQLEERIFSPTGVKYVQTRRSIAELIYEGTYPQSFFEPSDLQGKRVLDVGTGGGRFVLEMNDLGANALGIDIASHPNHAKNPELFKIADASDTKLPEKSFDQIYSSWSIFTYGEKLDFKLKVLTELKRVLKDGGKIRLGNVIISDIKKIARKIGGLKVSGSSKNNFSYGGSWIELTKIK